MIAHLLDQLHAVVTSRTFHDAKELMELPTAGISAGTFVVKLLPGKGRHRSSR
ncbi:hypothetical protein [Streptomyces griseoluteus]|uniref:hypothetical protein n=1 Tax=Streptomyces griseoluteus TaxID=29306 RepID=UPI0036C1AA34